VLRRVKRLEEVGVIHRYVALVQPEAVGLGLTAYVNVRLEKHAGAAKRNPMDEFRASVMGWAEVVECAALTGEMDFQLRLGGRHGGLFAFMMDSAQAPCSGPNQSDGRVKSTTAAAVKRGRSGICCSATKR
jgi:Lrp/AsnC family leucine-responsive transcriptional regulator